MLADRAARVLLAVIEREPERITLNSQGNQIQSDLPLRRCPAHGLGLVRYDEEEPEPLLSARLGPRREGFRVSEGSR